jgi:hypothetical protein
MKKIQLILTATAVALFSTSAFAAGGLAAGTTATTDFKNWIYAILAIVAIIILLWQVLLAYGKKITWIDFLGHMGWTAVGGGVPALVTYLWGVWA